MPAVLNNMMQSVKEMIVYMNVFVRQKQKEVEKLEASHWWTLHATINADKKNLTL